MIIGTFKYNADTDTFIGEIVTLHFQSMVRIEPARKKGEKQPDYRVAYATDNGTVELGACWKSISDKVGDYLWVLLDSPFLEAPLSLALFFDNSRKVASLVWNRPKDKAVPERYPEFAEVR